MANTTGGDSLTFTPWTTDRRLELPFGPPAASTVVYPAQALMRDGNGNLMQCDDTGKGEFVGVSEEYIYVQVDPTDVVQSNGVSGEKPFKVLQPVLFQALIAFAAPGDEGRKVYWLYNNQVSYTPGSNGNYAGTVWHVPNSTHVVVLPPWLERVTGGGMRSSMTLSATAASVTLTKWDVNRTFQCPATASQTVVLPPVAKTSSGDRICFVYTGSLLRTVTLQGNATESINGVNTLALGTSQYSRATVESDTTQWLQVA